MTDMQTHPFLADTGYERKPVTIWSEGSRMAGDLYLPAKSERPVPAILLAHGFGGIRSQLETYARIFAREGFAALIFDYRTFGESDARLIPAPGSAPVLGAGEQTLEVIAIRESVDPICHVEDVRAALNFLAAIPDVDPARIGLWGTSYGANHGLVVAARDPRIKAMVSQIGSIFFPRDPAIMARSAELATAKACGTIQPVVPQGIDLQPDLKGTPDFSRVYLQAAVDFIDCVAIPLLVIDAMDEELFDRREHGQRLIAEIGQRAPVKYVEYSGAHYGVYYEHFIPATREALAWFAVHL